MDLEKVNQFLESLDEKSRAIVLFIAKNRHAKIRELSNLVAAENDAYTLMKIKEVINSAAREILGEPALKFEESSIDKISGGKIFFSWQLNGKLEFLKSKEMLDIFDEDKYLRVVTEFAAANGSDLKYELKENVLSIANNDGTCRTIALPKPAKSIVGNSFKNNVLEIKLEKLTEGVKHG